MTYRVLDFDRLERKVQGPIIVPINQVVVDPNLVRERDVKHYVNAPSTQDWYFEPIRTVRLHEEQFEANGDYAHSMVEACARLGYKDLQIVFIDHKEIR